MTTSFTEMRISEAIQNGSRKKVNDLLKRGIRVNKLDSDGYAPIHWASQEGHLSILNDLIKYGANVNLTDVDGYVPLNVAAAHDHEDIISLLISVGADPNLGPHGYSSLHSASARGSIKAAKILIKAGANINGRDHDGEGRTPLHWAAQEANFDVLVYLIKCGAKINLIDDDHRTALSIAAGEGYCEICDELIKNGANGNEFHRKMKIDTPHELAVAWGHFDLAKALENHS